MSLKEWFWLMRCSAGDYQSERGAHRAMLPRELKEYRHADPLVIDKFFPPAHRFYSDRKQLLDNRFGVARW